MCFSHMSLYFKGKINIYKMLAVKYESISEFLELKLPREEGRSHENVFFTHHFIFRISNRY